MVPDKSQFDHSLYIKKTNEGMVIVLVYVDDILVTRDSLDQILATKTALHKAFQIKDLGELRYFLGIKFARSQQGIIMHQRKYALKLISETGLSEAKPASTPMDTTVKLTTTEYDQYLKEVVSSSDETLADQKYISHPDISYSVQNELYKMNCIKRIV